MLSQNRKSFVSEPRLHESIDSLLIRIHFLIPGDLIARMHIMFEICLGRHSEYWGKVGLSAYFHEDLRLGVLPLKKRFSHHCSDRFKTEDAQICA